MSSLIWYFIQELGDRNLIVLFKQTVFVNAEVSFNNWLFIQEAGGTRQSDGVKL